MSIKVDIMTPAYKEPLSVIERMFKACHSQELLSEIDLQSWLCIDGMSESDELSIMRLAKQYHINISKRPKRKGFRAGALNYCIQNKIRKDSEYLIVLDIDQAPKPKMVTTLVVEMQTDENKNTHFIMFPQVAENKDENAITRASDILQRYDYYFNRRIRSSTNSAFVVGTNWIGKTAVIRKFPWEEESIVEDQSSSIKWQSEGAVIKVINTELASGLAPNSIDSWRAQQFRWSYGGIYNIKFLIRYWNKLTFWQRVDYTSCMTWYLYAIPTVLSMLVPIVTFFEPITKSNPLLPIGLLFANLVVFTVPILYCRNPILSIKEVFQTAAMQDMCLDLYLKAVWYNIIGKKYSYVVSDKSSKVCKHPHKNLWFSYLLISITMTAMAIATYMNPPSIERYTRVLRGYPLVITTYIIIWLILSIFWIWGTVYYAHKSNSLDT